MVASRNSVNPQGILAMKREAKEVGFNSVFAVGTKNPLITKHNFLPQKHSSMTSPCLCQVTVHCRRWVLGRYARQVVGDWPSALSLAWRAYEWESALELGGAIGGYCVAQVGLVMSAFGVKDEKF